MVLRDRRKRERQHRRFMNVMTEDMQSVGVTKEAAK